MDVPAEPPVTSSDAGDDDYAPNALPSPLARALAFVAVLIGGACGGLIGYAIVDLQCEGDCATTAGVVGIATAALGAIGVAVVAVLALRAMGEWRTVQHRQPPNGKAQNRKRR